MKKYDHHPYNKIIFKKKLKEKKKWDIINIVYIYEDAAPSLRGK